MTSSYPADPINTSVVRLRLLFNDVELGKATGFFYNVEFNGTPALYLVTNWHVASGRSTEPPYLSLHKEGGIPNRLAAELLLKDPPVGHEGKLVFQETFIPLYADGGEPLWYQHPLGAKVDIAAMNLGTSTAPYHVSGITDHAHDHDMAIRVASNLYILGYPLGFTHFLKNPIWKRGSIASEPHQEEEGQAPRIVIDATTRGGMSGSPVIMRADTHYLSESGEVKIGPGATRFIGV